MGLDIDRTWHGAYTTFHEFRRKLCEVSGLGKYEDFKGLGEPGTKDWPVDKEIPICILLNHSDCDGEIKWKQAKPLADAMETLLPSLKNADWFCSPGREWYHRSAVTFIEGLRWHHENKKNVEFH